MDDRWAVVCAITIHEFAWIPVLEHQLMIHSFNVLKLDEIQFMYAPGAVAHPPKI
jgi:hypothetical protein